MLSTSFHEEAEQERIRQRFERAGLDPERLILLGWIEGGINHLQLYSQLDALDQFPWWCDYYSRSPLNERSVVSLQGEGMVGRLSASLLHHAGFSQWIAESIEEYVDIAQNLALQGNRSRDERMRLRNTLNCSAVADGKRLSGELERIYGNLRQSISCS